MTASFEAACRGSLSRLRAERFRALLLVVMAEQAAEFERHADTLATLTEDSRGRTTDRDRAIAALRMFSAREALERIEDALARIHDGNYAICQSCGRPIALDRLEATPQAQLCAACGTNSSTARTPSVRSVRLDEDARWPDASVKRLATTMTTSAREAR